MSKSIYGLRMPGTMGDVIHQLDGLRPLMAQKATRLLAQAVARIATDRHDRAEIFGADTGENHLSRAWRDVEERIREITLSNTRDPEVDTSFEAVICDDGDHAIIMSFTEHEDWFSDLLSLPGASDFSYWDGTDRPDDVTAEDWAHRRRTYQRILSRDPHGRPAGCGVSLVYQKPVGAPSVAEVLAEVPCAEARARRMARQIMLAEWADEQDGEALDVTAFTEFAARLSSPAMAGEIDARAASLRDVLPSIDEARLKGALLSPEREEVTADPSP